MLSVCVDSCQREGSDSTIFNQLFTDTSAMASAAVGGRSGREQRENIAIWVNEHDVGQPVFVEVGLMATSGVGPPPSPVPS